MVPTDPSDVPAPPWMVRRKRALWVAALGFLWWVLDLNLARTILVTPISSFVWLTVTTIAAAVGLWVGYAVADGEMRKPPLDTSRAPRRRAVIILMCAMGLVFGAMIGNRAMWRSANAVRFWVSDAPITIAAFPIRAVSRPRGGPVVSIGSNGEGDSLPISKNDLRLLERAKPLRPPWIYCLELRRQEQGDAVRIWVPSRPRLTSKAITLKRCPAEMWWV